MIEVVVIGGGLAGAATALALAERGAAVNVVDGERPGSAATGASAGMLAPQYESAGPGPLYRVLIQCRAAFPAFADTVHVLTGEDIDVRWDGMLVANLTEAEHAAGAAMLEWQRAHGQRGELLDPGRAAALQPGIARDVPSWVWLPDEGQADAQRLAALLGGALTAAGVRVLAGRRVSAVRHAGGAVQGVVLEDGRHVPGDAVVVAAGAWSASLGGLPVPVAVRPVRGHILRYGPGSASLRRIVASHAGRYLVPRSDGTILAGSTMDESGFDRSIDDASLAVVRDAAARLVPDLADAQPAERWADLRPISADGLPVIGPDPELDGLFYATGYGRNGILLGPLAGHVAANMILDLPVPPEWNGFRPRRQAGGPPHPESG
jgi:glycine oxidase